MAIMDIVQGVVRLGINVAAGMFVESQLNKLVKKTIVNNIVKLLLFLAAVFIPHFLLGVLFGKNVSLFVSSALLLALLVHTALNLVPKILQAIRIIPMIPFGIIAESAGPSDFVARYVYSIHPFVFKLKAKLDAKLDGWIPSADDLVSYVWGYVGKQVVVFVLSMAVFLAAFTFVVKPMLLSAVVGVYGIRLYAAPFAMAADYIFGANFMRWLAGT
ncbi:MAG: hypothetical protein LBB48_02705 [Treponema sp.]|jgi:hypothetical protein|nr:hypothetical protein [Treponema sp.]